MNFINTIPRGPPLCSPTPGNVYTEQTDESYRESLKKCNSAKKLKAPWYDFEIRDEQSDYMFRYFIFSLYSSKAE